MHRERVLATLSQLLTQNQDLCIGPKKVEIAKSIDDLMTSRLIPGRKDFANCDMLLTHVHFRKRVSVDEQRAQKYDRFLRGRRIAHMIYEHFRATGDYYEAVQGLSGLFSTRLQNDDVQDFDTRWDQALFAASENPAEMVLEDSYKSKIAGF